MVGRVGGRVASKPGVPQRLLELVLARPLEVGGLGKGVHVVVAVPEVVAIVVVVVLREGGKALGDSRGVVGEAG